MATLEQIQQQQALLQQSLAAQGIQMPGMSPEAPAPGPSAPMPPAPSLAGPPSPPTDALIHAMAQNAEANPELGAMALPPAAGTQMPPAISLANAGVQSTGYGLPQPAPTPPPAPPAAQAPGPAAPPAAAPGEQMSAMPAQAPRLIAAGWDDRRVPFRPETRAALMGHMSDEQAAYGRAQAYTQMQAEHQADAMGAEAERAQASIAERALREDQRQQFVRSHLARAQEAVDIAAKGEVNPDQWFQTRDTFQKVIAGIGITLGGGVAAATGGANPAENMIEGAIQRNIDGQKATLQLRQQGIVNQQNMLGLYRDAFGDERLAELALEQSTRQIAMQKMQAEAIRDGNPITLSNAEKAIAQMQQLQDQTKMKFEALAHHQAQLLGVGGGQSIDPGRIVRMPDGSVRVVGTTDEGKADRTKAGAVANIQSNIDAALELRKSASTIDMLNPYSAVRKKLESLQAETAQLVTVARDQGAMSKGDQEVADNAVGSMTGVLGSNDAVLRSTRERFGKQFDRLVTAQGGEQVATGYGYDPKGNIVPKQAYVGKADAPPAGMVKKVARSPVK